MVTGAGRNIGAEIARLLAAEGARVAIVDVDRARAEAVAGAIGKAGGEAAAIVADVTSARQIAAMAEAVIGRWGRIDILVNNAAMTDNKTILEIDEEEWARVLAVTLTGPFLVTKCIAAHMVAAGRGGRIVNIGSTSGHRGRDRAIAYTAAKGGLVNLTRSMAVQLAPYDIRVNSVSPNKAGSAVGEDALDPNRPVANLMGRLATPAEVAKAVLFLVSEDAGFIAGENIFVDGGNMAIQAG